MYFLHFVVIIKPLVIAVLMMYPHSPRRVKTLQDTVIVQVACGANHTLALSQSEYVFTKVQFSQTHRYSYPAHYGCTFILCLHNQVPSFGRVLSRNFCLGGSSGKGAAQAVTVVGGPGVLPGKF